MTDIMPKITDAKSLKDLSKILALPMVMVAYVFQTGAVIGWGVNVWLDIPLDLAPEIQLHRLFLIFILKAVWSGVTAACMYTFLAVTHVQLNEWLLPIIAVILFALALFGLLGSAQFPQLRTIDRFWFYTAMVWGFYLVAMTDQIHNQLLPEPTKGPQSTAAGAMVGNTDTPLPQ